MHYIYIHVCVRYKVNGANCALMSMCVCPIGEQYVYALHIYTCVWVYVCVHVCVCVIWSPLVWEA
jgi:hypothetical protein